MPNTNGQRNAQWNEQVMHIICQSQMLEDYKMKQWQSTCKCIKAQIHGKMHQWSYWRQQDQNMTVSTWTETRSEDCSNIQWHATEYTMKTVVDVEKQAENVKSKSWKDAKVKKGNCECILKKIKSKTYLWKSHAVKEESSLPCESRKIERYTNQDRMHQVSVNQESIKLIQTNYRVSEFI